MKTKNQTLEQSLNKYDKDVLVKFICYKIGLFSGFDFERLDLFQEMKNSSNAEIKIKELNSERVSIWEKLEVLEVEYKDKSAKFRKIAEKPKSTKQLDKAYREAQQVGEAQTKCYDRLTEINKKIDKLLGLN